MSKDQEPVCPYPFAEPQGLEIDPAYRELMELEGMRCVQPPYGGTTYLAVRHADVRAVLNDPRFSRAESVGEDEPRLHPFVPRPDSLTAMDPPGHTRLRKALTAAFTARRMEAFAPTVREIVEARLDALEAAGSPADLVDLFALPVPILVICQLLGVPYEDRDKFVGWAGATLATADSGLSPEEINAARMQMFGYLSELVALRRNQEEPGTDLLSVLVEAHDEGGSLTEGEMLGLASSVLVAGHETTANQIAGFVYTLLSNRERWEELVADPTLVPRAVEELLRVVPVTATAGFSRMATEDVRIGEQLVRQGERVMPTLFTANTDPEVFENPQDIDFHRPNGSSHVAFSYGAHHCPGNQLARLELQVALEALLRRFPELALAGDDAVTWKKSLMSRGPLKLTVTW
ncbi:MULTISPECIES: cytochrome P450 [Streptomyces]|uniref:cytochrome P450 n=1 Tax=Streptomyces TaxID=1883 RepID=UPI0004AB4C78|nr:MULTISPECIES: cytochrome P450 [Streptomyces]